MFYWALVFLLIALTAGFFGFGVLTAAGAASIGKLLFIVFMVLALASGIMGLAESR